MNPGWVGVVLLAASLALPARACDGLRGDAAWVRLPPPTVGHAAAYLALRNEGRSPVVVRGVTSPAFTHAMLHETRFVDGHAEMRHLDAITVPPGDGYALAPGGAHLMLSGARAALEEGHYVELVLTCAQGPALSVWAEIRRGPP